MSDAPVYPLRLGTGHPRLLLLFFAEHCLTFDFAIYHLFRRFKSVGGIVSLCLRLLGLQVNTFFSKIT